MKLHRTLWIPGVWLSLMLIGCGGEWEPGEPDDTRQSSSALRFGSFSFDDRAVGLLRRGNGRICTASLIHPKAIVTAAHCVGYTTGNLGMGSFVVHHSDSKQYAYPLRRAKSYGTSVGNDDVAVIELLSAVPMSVARSMEMSTVAITQREAVIMYGYGCRATAGDSFAGRKQRFTTLFDLDTTYGCPGDSGGPVMHASNKRIAKVFSGSSRTPSFHNEYGLISKHKYAILKQLDDWFQADGSASGSDGSSDSSSGSGGGGGGGGTGSILDPPTKMK